LIDAAMIGARAARVDYLRRKQIHPAGRVMRACASVADAAPPRVPAPTQPLPCLACRACVARRPRNPRRPPIRWKNKALRALVSQQMAAQCQTRRYRKWMAGRAAR